MISDLTINPSCANCSIACCGSQCPYVYVVSGTVSGPLRLYGYPSVGTALTAVRPLEKLEVIEDTSRRARAGPPVRPTR